MNDSELKQFLQAHLQDLQGSVEVRYYQPNIYFEHYQNEREMRSAPRPEKCAISYDRDNLVRVVCGIEETTFVINQENIRDYLESPNPFDYMAETMKLKMMEIMHHKEQRNIEQFNMLYREIKKSQDSVYRMILKYATDNETIFNQAKFLRNNNGERIIVFNLKNSENLCQYYNRFILEDE